MPEIVITYIMARDHRITYGFKREEGDEEVYQNFLKERGLIDIDGKSAYKENKPKST